MKLISIDPIQKFYKIGSCPNCKSNLWRKDWKFNYQTRGTAERFSCFYCGEDHYPDAVQLNRGATEHHA